LVGLERLVKMIRAIEIAMGDGKKKFTKTEQEVRKKLAPTAAAMGQ
jgi:hypothetical protein